MVLRVTGLPPAEAMEKQIGRIKYAVLTESQDFRAWRHAARAQSNLLLELLW